MPRPGGRLRWLLALLALLVVVALAAQPVAAGAAETSPSPSTSPSTGPSTEPTPTGSPTPTPTPTPTGSPTPTPTPSPTDPPTPSATTTATSPATPTASPVTGATLRWGLNQESSNRAFAPGTYNFFSAGRAPDPGRGGVTLDPAAWQQQSGSVRIEKWDGTAWRPATWAGLGTDATGAPLGAPSAGTTSGHTFVFSGGTGTVDRSAGTASITWSGDVSVLYYSGMSLFHLSDPALEVRDGRGTLSGTLSGYASSQGDTGVWAPVAPQRVTLAELPQVDLADPHGLTAVPSYRGVTVSGVAQTTGGPHDGAFPQSWVDYAGRLGTAAFWYSSGASTDPYKVALPITVGLDDQVAAPAPPAPTRSAQAPPVRSTAAPLPPRSTRPPADAPAAAPGAVAPAPVAAPPVAAVPTTDGEPVPVPTRPGTALALAGASAAGPPAPDRSWSWWLGGALLLCAALTLLVPPGHRGRTGPA